MAATFDEEALQKMAAITSDEARAIHNEYARTGKEGDQYSGLTFWTPNINIFRDPRWGRGQETYGEDPYLTAQMGTAMVKGLQGNDPKYLKVSACAKHYAVHSGPEALRHVFDVDVSDYDLWDTYLPAFKKLITEANVSSVMCAYNRVGGQPCCGNDRLMTDILRNKWNFTGYVTSDCGGVEDIYKTHKTQPDAASAAANAVLHGTDLECGGTYRALNEAVKSGKLTEKDIDVSVKRLFMIRFRLGMFDPKNLVPYGNTPMSVVESKGNATHALKMARESMVLLKNERNTLPLQKNIKKIAVVGPNAADENALLGNYNGFPSHTVTVLAGIKAKVSAQTQVVYEQGCGYTNENLFEKAALDGTLSFQGKSGWQAEYFTNPKLEATPVVTRMVSTIDLDKTQQEEVAPGVPAKNASIRYSTVFVPAKAGNYVFEFASEQGYRFLVNSKKCVDQWYDHENSSKEYVLRAEAGKEYALVVEFNQKGNKAALHLQTGKTVTGNKAALVEKVKDADAIVFVGGISNAFEAEGSDKKNIDLPAVQTEYLKALQATGKPVIFVMYTGSALNIEWEAQNLPAILNAWYAGQSAGTAVADILFGDYNPAGRLPVTFYKGVNELPAIGDYSMKNRTYRYFKGTPIYPFGYGLSYTSFGYEWSKQPLTTYTQQDTISFTVAVRNTGKRDGEEVLQAYIQYPADKGLPMKELRQFKRVAIAGNTTQKVVVKIPVAALKKWDSQQHSEKLYAGQYRICVGSSATDQKLTAPFTVN